jgi:cyclomaltodextrinase / maltogenic alpha-amylase / neopullulanase
MEDFIFGTLSTDALKLVHHRTARQGIQHAHMIDPLDPKAGERVTISITIGPEAPAEQVVCYYTEDGSQPDGSRGEARNGEVLQFKRVGVEWDNFRWNYLSRWEARIPAQQDGAVVRYRIGAWSAGGEEVYADWPDIKRTIEEAARAYFNNEPVSLTVPGDPASGTTFNFHVDRLQPPEWARQAVIYQIFVDRFFPGKGKGWLLTTDLKDFFGGTLWGVTEKLDYIAELGASCIWLSPIFPSPTTHGYDASDYERVEARLGGDEALRELVREAHRRDIRVILDLVCNHVSDQHPYFLDARANPGSRYRDWFHFDDPRFGYRAYFGVPSMPELNLENQDTREWMIRVARYWLREFEIDGYRLDYAIGPGPSFWSDFWAECKRENPEAFCFGEVVEAPPSILKLYGRLDGALDFNLADALRRTCAYRTWDERMLSRFLDQHLSYFPADFLMPTFLDNHDMDRFLFAAGNDKSQLRKAAAFQMQLPGPPVIYYGTEIGMSQAVSKASQVGLEASRMAMPWDQGRDVELLNFYKQMIRERLEKKPWVRRP